MSKRNIIRVTAGVITRNGRILLCRRRAGGGPLGGKWEFPGGKVEKGEKPSLCLIREIKEELGIDICPQRYLGRVDHHYDHVSIRLLFYYAEYAGGRIIRTDHDRTVWVPVDDIKRYDLAPADEVFLPRLIRVLRQGFLLRNQSPS
jgi:8-oxo-dGTP diphosphatase